MGYLICEKCGGYYELLEGESLNDFEECQCGGALFEIKSLEKYLNQKGIPSPNKEITISDIKKFEHKKDVESLIELLAHENQKIRSSAIISLGNIRNKKVYHHLLTFIDDKNPRVRANSIVALGKLKDEKALDVILPKLNDKNNRVRVGVIRALEQIGGEISFNTIIQGLDDKHYSVRRRSAVALGNIGNKKATPYLTKALDDKHHMVRIKTAKAIRKIEGDEIAALIIGYKGEERVIKWLNKLNNQFTVLNNILIPGSWGGNIDHVVLGKNGIFVIETKNFNIPYIIKGNEWYSKKGKKETKLHKNPSKQLKANTTFLGHYLRSNNVYIPHTSIFPILAYVNTEKLIINEEPDDFSLIKPKEIPKFIIETENEIKNYILKKSIELLEQYVQKDYYNPYN